VLIALCGPCFGQGGDGNSPPAAAANEWPTDPAITRAPYLAGQYTNAGGDPGIASVVNGPVYAPGAEEEQLSARLAPPMIGDDFFGNLTGLGSLIPGEFTGQAIFFPAPNVNDTDYFRRVDPAGPGTFITNNLVLVPSGDVPPGTNINPLLEFDDNGTFVGDPADLGALIDAGPFVAIPDGIGGTVNLLAPEAGGPLANEPLFDIHRLAFANVPLPGQVVGRTKISQNNSPVPRNRVYMDFSDINDMPLTADGINVRRFAPGAEWTFWGGQASWEIRVPMAVTLDTEITADGLTDTSKGELGDVAVTLKHLLYRDDVWAYSIGLMVTAPTASDVQIKLADETELLEVSNQTVHIMPFWGALYTPSDRFFAQMFIQGDFDASGSKVKVNDFRGGFNNIGTLHDTSFFFADVSLGFWIYRSLPTITRTYSPEGVQQIILQEHGPLHLSGVAPMIEFHYNRSLDETDTLSSSGFQIGRTQDSIETWNLALGGTLEFGPKVTAQAAYVQPLGGGPDKQFAGEVRVFLNIWLGTP
jgi:hypothetical protein